MKRTLLLSLFTTAILFTFISSSFAQWSQDFRKQMEIPGVINLESSDSHFYVLSESEGLVVFRAHPDSLQWLYTSTGMQQRGNILESDIRFAYLYGNNRRLTVIEPTSVLGVYSSTVLPQPPRAVKRVGNNLYIALGTGGLGKLSLQSPESVDTQISYIDQNRFSNSRVNDLATDRNQILYVLSDNRAIDIYTIRSDDEQAVVEHTERVETDRATQRIFLTGDELLGSGENGTIFLINSDGRTRSIADVGNAVNKLRIWNNQLVVHTVNNNLWIGPFQGTLQQWKSNERAGNFFTVSENQLWISEFNNLSPVIRREVSDSGQAGGASDGRLQLKEIRDVIIPFPRPLIMPIELESSVDASVTFSYEAPFTNARIRGNTFYWQPSATQTGRHQIEIAANSDDGQSHSRQFSIDVRPFNAPPRFTPARPVTIPIGEAFQLDIKAVDPDGTDPNLIRYLGVDMPDGSRLNEKTGLFTWNPNIRQVGTHRFQVVATDQYGAAASQNFEITVVEISEGESTLQEEQ
jgi:hypothetical protein